MTAVYYEMQDVLRRYYDDNGAYIEPSGIADGGDNTGMIYAANSQVLSKLDEEIKRAREAMQAIFAEIDAYKSERFGPGYKPLPRKL